MAKQPKTTETSTPKRIPVARIRVASGPDSGKVFRVSDKLVRIGNDPDNAIALSDPQVLPLHATIRATEDGYMILVSPDAQVQLNQEPLDCDCWVPLPNRAQLLLGVGTELEFTRSRKPPTTQAREGGRAKQRPLRARTAQFVSTNDGDVEVSLGDDGRLPELHLQALSAGDSSDSAKEPAEKASTLKYLALAGSLVATMGLLLVDTVPMARRANLRQTAIVSIRDFYGDEHRDLKPYQLLLRQAQLARSRGDRQAEVRAYRGVLATLNSEDINPFTGLTGSLDRDHDLRQYIGQLLSN